MIDPNFHVAAISLHRFLANGGDEVRPGGFQAPCVQVGKVAFPGCAQVVAQPGLQMGCIRLENDGKSF